MVLQDIRRGRGVALIDPHADLVERVVAQVPPQRAAHVIYLNAADPSQPHGEDPLRHVREDRIALADLGDALGIAFQQVQKYENGTNRIGLPASPPREKAAACTHKTRQNGPAAGESRPAAYVGVLVQTVYCATFMVGQTMPDEAANALSMRERMVWSAWPAGRICIGPATSRGARRVRGLSA